MADIGVQYALNTPGPTITFNQFTVPFNGNDQYYLTEIRGLESPALRTPTDNVPLGDGGLVHDYWKGPRHIEVEGFIMVGSTQVEDSVVVIRNDMTDDLIDALESILRADGTFSYTPQGQGNRTYTVRYEVGLQTTHVDNYQSLQFTFGLIAAEPDWAGAS